MKVGDLVKVQSPTFRPNKHLKMERVSWATYSGVIVEIYDETYVGPQPAKHAIMGVLDNNSGQVYWVYDEDKVEVISVT